MTYKERSYEEIEKVLGQWVEAHPKPNEPTIFMGRPYSPKDILEEVQGKTDFGKDFVSFLQQKGQEYDMDPLDYVQRHINKKDEEVE